MIGFEFGPHQVYRLFDADGRLLYVGSTYDIHSRILAHRRVASWWAEVASATTEQYPNRRFATAAERATIADEAPTHNRDRALRPTDHGDRERSRGAKLSSLRSLPEKPFDLGIYRPRAKRDKKVICRATRAGTGDDFTELHCPGPSSPYRDWT